MNPRDLHPPKLLRDSCESRPDHWRNVIVRTTAATADELRARNAELFASAMITTPETIAEIWVINRRFTTLGIAPRWRGLPLTVTRIDPQETHDTPAGPRLNAGPIRTHLRRWIDLQWLRVELGPGHPTRATRRAKIFGIDEDQAHAAMYSAVLPGSADKRPPPWRLLREMSVPEAHQKALSGFLTVDTIDSVLTLRKWLDGPLRAALDAHALRKRHTLTLDQREARRIDIECIELADGSPTTAALFRRWMQGWKDHETQTTPAGKSWMVARRKELPEDIPALRRRTAWGYVHPTRKSAPDAR